MKLTARNDQITIKSQSKPDFASGKYGYWQKFCQLGKKVKFEPWIRGSASLYLSHIGPNLTSAYIFAEQI